MTTKNRMGPGRSDFKSDEERTYWWSLGSRWVALPGFRWHQGMRDILGDEVVEVSEGQINWCDPKNGIQSASLAAPSGLFMPDLRHMPTQARLANQVYSLLLPKAPQIRYESEAGEYHGFVDGLGVFSGKTRAELLIEIFEAECRKGEQK